jgi:hypothetical protein
MFLQFFSKLLGSSQSKFRKYLLILVLFALFFQIVHFGEHLIQVIAWIIGYREAPYMSAIGHYLVNTLGTFFYSDSAIEHQMMMGNEILHLIGNIVYIVGTTGILFFVKTRYTISAAIIEAFHLYEHICLTISAAVIGMPIGMSTFWGLSMDPALSVTTRVWWHFLMNAIPTTLSILALYIVYRIISRKKVNSSI